VYVLEYGCELNSRKGTGESEDETNDVRFHFSLARDKNLALNT